LDKFIEERVADIKLRLFEPAFTPAYLLRYVRNHLDEVNPRLRAQGKREIDLTDREMAERYGLVQEPVEAEVVEERPDLGAIDRFNECFGVIRWQSNEAWLGACRRVADQS
jgi:hypothetical protein